MLDREALMLNPDFAALDGCQRKLVHHGRCKILLPPFAAHTLGRLCISIGDVARSGRDTDASSRVLTGERVRWRSARQALGDAAPTRLRPAGAEMVGW